MRSQANVRTEDPARYAKQLVSHLGRRVEWTTTDGTSVGHFASGVGTIAVRDGVLTLIAEASDPESLDRVKDVLGRHLERFGQRNELSVTWRDE